MTTLKFKSTIKCTGCIATVSPELNNLSGITHWEVDLESPDRVLTVESESGDPKQVISALQAVGYQAELLPKP